jgi:Na+/proline symporter
MFPIILLSIIAVYFAVLFGIARFTSKNADSESFYVGNRNSKWWVVAFGMIGTSLSGITFISVPGTVATSGFEYLQVAAGYVLGYFATAFILLPIYYKRNLTSIYTYLEQRLGNAAYKTGAVLFIISRTLGATLRLYLVIHVLEGIIFEQLGIPFWAVAIAILLLILLYTIRGGVKTIVWTDTLQTTCMLGSLIVCAGFILSNLHQSPASLTNIFAKNNFLRVINTDVRSPGFFLKQIVGGAFITIAMTGLDQEMMQKNISVSSLKDARKNMLTFSMLQLAVVLLFLFLGGCLYVYGSNLGGAFQDFSAGGKKTVGFVLNQTNIIGDKLFPTLATQYLPPFISIIFVIGLISALFPSADGALTALTASFCIDILGILKPVATSKTNKTIFSGFTQSEVGKQRLRKLVHYSFTVVFLICVFVFEKIDNGSIIDVLLKIAGYTYGPLLALFAFGIFTRRQLGQFMVPIACIAAPCASYLLKENEAVIFNGYHIGIELLLINGVITFFLLLLFSRRGVSITINQ